MGIPRFSRWLAEVFPDAFSHKAGVEVDHVYIDMNTVLHEVLQSLGNARDGPSESAFLNAVLKRLDEILHDVPPRRSVFLAIDGPAVCAKISLQRRRRFERAAAPPQSHQRKGGKSKGRGRNAGQQRHSSKGGPDGVTSNMLTPGVPFMAHVSASLERHCRARMGLEADGSITRWQGCIEAGVSSASSAGEGEHKIAAAVMCNEARAQEAGSEEARTHAVVGTDSDLFLLPLGPHEVAKRVLIVVPQASRYPQASNYRVCDVAALLRSIRAQWQRLSSGCPPGLAAAAAALSGAANGGPAPRTALTEEGERTLRRDFILVSLMRGNDYLPPLSCDCGAENLWPRYLQWRREATADVGIIIPIEESAARPDVAAGTKISFHSTSLTSFMSYCAERPVALTPGTAQAERTEGVREYLCGLMWCLDTYIRGQCSNFRFQCSKSCTESASAARIAEHATTAITSTAFSSIHEVALPLLPLAFAVAVLPAEEVKRLLLPSTPWLAPLLEEGFLDSIDEMTPSGRMGGSRQEQSSVDDIDVVGLEAEVQRLYQKSTPAAGGAAAMAFSSEVTFSAPGSAEEQEGRSKRPSDGPAAAEGAPVAKRACLEED